MDCNQRGARADRALSALPLARSGPAEITSACWMGGSSSRVRAARPPVAVRTCCRPGATSSRSIARGADGGRLASRLALGGAADRATCRSTATGRALALSAWGTASGTGGDDLAQALALLGARPLWTALAPGHRHRDPAAQPARPPPRRCHAAGFGLFRDAFPAQIALFDRAVQEIAALDEPVEQNPIAARVRADEYLVARALRPSLPPRELSRVRLEAGSVWRGCRR